VLGVLIFAFAETVFVRCSGIGLVISRGSFCSLLCGFLGSLFQSSHGFVLCFLLKHAWSEVPNILICHLILHALIVKFIANGHRPKGTLLLLRHIGKGNDGGRQDIFGFVPLEEISDGKQRDVAECH
jgi:hypothetical protein